MAVLQMQRISICALKKNRKQILENLQLRGVVEITDLSPQDSVFEKIDTSSAKAQFEKIIAVANHALEVLDSYVPVKSSMLDTFAGRNVLSGKEYGTLINRRDETVNLAYQLTALSKKIAENKAEILKIQTQMDTLVPWLSLDVSMRFTGTRTTAGFIGSFAEELSLETLYEKLVEHAPDVSAVNVDLISQTKEQTCVLVLTPRADSAKVEEALRAIGFIRPVSPSKEKPSERKAILEGRLAQAHAEIENAENEIKSYADARDSLRFIIDDFAMRSEKYSVISNSLQSRRTFILSGYIPQRNAAALEAELNQKFDLAIQLETPAEDEDVPVLLHNNKFTEPVEDVLASYGLPQKGEIDPTPIMSIFYYFLFGLMLSDFAYGAMLSIGTGFLLMKFKNMEYNMRKTLRMFFFCGISTAFWGIVFSSYFGDVVNVVSRTFFGHEVGIPPLWFAPLEDPMRMLVFSMGVGVIHLFAGLAIQLYLCIRRRDYKSAICNVVFWYMLVGGLIVYFLSMEMAANILQIKSTLPASVGSIGGWAAAIGAVGIVFTNGDSKNPAVKFAQGLYALYNVTGYLSDILSYSRLLALGLATGVVGSVINQMGAMAGGGIVGAILFIAVFLVGHVINFGIELLGAYVHTNRLQFVEFFGKFYEGGGRKFDPFAVHTKYYKFEEDY
ncbi:V-type ATP synthase subunit I [Oscillospiraceae bacterium PP1C4]